ncbi:hypothetical protein [Spiroplasma floricola]|uniref:Uncharacterized protein n=1 Tax=Spiroplasma floricola 23-6 TaxID=1336749 RepID=A0A2K8SCX8_9MOLU|nr:hypothetical protein [Spiroplasma floricola]AUB31319.1 hypothetical protein SFLOR_v1c02620 [Spiroplasma floricola 23-6]
MLLAGLSTGTFWTLFGFGILGLLLGICSTIFFVVFKRNKKLEKESFKVVSTKFKIFRFWQYYGIFTLALVGYLMALIFLGICLGEII